MNIGVIFAGGVGIRMNSNIKPKQFLEIYNKPIIIHTLEYFEKNSEIDTIIVVCVEEWIAYLQMQLRKFNITKVQSIVSGGINGQASIYNGLCEAEKISCGEKSIVLIHDGVRPLIKDELITRNIECVQKYGSAITSSIVKETIVAIDNDMNVEMVPSRELSRVAKAPQSFWLEDIMSCHRQALTDGITNFIDSCTMMKHYGYKLKMVDGPYENIKITTPDDYYTMKAILDIKENAQVYGMD